MGLGGKIKHVASSATSAVQSAGSTIKTVANAPVVQATVTVAASALAGPAGTQAVNQAYSVMNAEGGVMGKLTAGYQSSGLSQVTGVDLAKILQTGKQYQQYYEPVTEAIYDVQGVVQGVVNTAKTVYSVKRKGLISTILDWLF